MEDERDNEAVSIGVRSGVTTWVDDLPDVEWALTVGAKGRRVRVPIDWETMDALVAVLQEKLWVHDQVVEPHLLLETKPRGSSRFRYREGETEVTSVWYRCSCGTSGNIPKASVLEHGGDWKTAIDARHKDHVAQAKARVRLLVAEPKTIQSVLKRNAVLT